MDVTTTLIGGALLAFGAAVIAIGIDLQETVKNQLGTFANTSVLSVRQGWMILACWGIVVALMYLVIIHNKEWARGVFGFEVDKNELLAGFAVGISALVVIRSKIAKVGTVEIGGEYAYLWSRAYVLDAVNSGRLKKRVETMRRYKAVVEDVTTHPTLFTDLEGWMTSLAIARDAQVVTKIAAQVAEIKKQTSGTPDSDKAARKYLVGVVIDFVSPAALDEFAAANGIEIPA